MNPEQKLADIVRALHQGGIEALVMGGHAVRYYGITRNTIDYDLVTSVASTSDLWLRLQSIGHFHDATPVPAWRQSDFARFLIGRLADGREEYLEFWLRNHLLGDFDQLKRRAEIGPYGGQPIAFLSIPDLIRSKETERESDWQDIALLEEVMDSRNFATIDAGQGQVADVLADLRSRRGMGAALRNGLLVDPNVAAAALVRCTHPAPFALLLPFARRIPRGSLPHGVDASHLGLLQAVEAGSPKHFAIIEVVRRAYKRRAMDVDRADKQDQLNRP